MTEEEWLVERRPLWMANDLICRSRRKRRLFVVACIQRFPDLLKDKILNDSLHWAEAYVDNAADETTRKKLYREASSKGPQASLQESLARALLEPSFDRKYVMTLQFLYEELGNWQDRTTDQKIAREEKAQKELVFEIFGNPFRPITPAPNLLSWNDGAIPQIAEAIYEERRFEDISILADALEDAGCEPALLDHCRNERPHVRGCWVIDLLLGKK